MLLPPHFFGNIFIISREYYNLWYIDKTQHHRILSICWWYSDCLQRWAHWYPPCLRPINNASTTLSFTIEKEKSNIINFLDISICKNNNISFKIYRKPTATDHVIPHVSNHPLEHKMSAINYLTNRLITYPLNDIDKNKEHETVRHILHNDKCDPQLLDRTMSTVNTKLQIQQDTYTTSTKYKTKCTTFTI